MPKAVILFWESGEAGAIANEIILRARVLFTDAAGSTDVDTGTDGRGVPVTINVTQLAQYPDRVEDALIARGAALPVPLTLARADCLFPTYQRGA